VTGFAHGLVIGKFYPPHAGHEHLVRIAAAGARRVTVVVMSSAADSIPLAERVRWMRAIHADGGNVHVTGLPCDIPFDLGDRTVWAAQVAGMRAAVQQVTSEPLDAVFIPCGMRHSCCFCWTLVPEHPKRVPSECAIWISRIGDALFWEKVTNTEPSFWAAAPLKR